MRTHKEILKHLRAELEAQGVLVVGVRLNKRTAQYVAHSANFVADGHVFVWVPGTTTVRVRRIDAGGKEQETGTLTIGA